MNQKPGDKTYLVQQKLVSPGQVAQLVKALSPYAGVAGSILGQGTYKEQLMHA